MGKKVMLIFSGFNQRAVISFIRTLEKNQIEYAIIAVSETDDILLTKYKQKVLAIRNNKNLVLSDLIDSIKKVQDKTSAEEYIIAPSTEALNRFLLKERKVLERINCYIPLVNKELYELVSDKYSFGELCNRHEIITPKELYIDEKIEYPIVAKPKKYFSSMNNEILAPIIIENEMDYKKFKTRYNADDFYFQKYVGGKSLYLLYYFHTNGEVYKFSQANLMQQFGGKSMLVAKPSNFHKSDESAKYEELFKNINYFGLVMIEVKQDNNKNYMIEANPRFWGPSQLFVDAGINFFEYFLQDIGALTNVSEMNEIKSNVKYCWLGGLGKGFKDLYKASFYSYTKEEFHKDFFELINNDIYFREDTQKIFTKELLSFDGGNLFEDE